MSIPNENTKKRRLSAESSTALRKFAKIGTNSQIVTLFVYHGSTCSVAEGAGVLLLSYSSFPSEFLQNVQPSPPPLSHSPPSAILPFLFSHPVIAFAIFCVTKSTRFVFRGPNNFSLARRIFSQRNRTSFFRRRIDRC